MYNIDEKVLSKILKRRFDCLYGPTCEMIEKIFQEDIEKDVMCKLIKEILGKNVYNTMRTVREQISSFSNGTKINIKLERPISE